MGDIRASTPVFDGLCAKSIDSMRGDDRFLGNPAATPGAYPRESNDTLSENAFCRVAPSVRLRARAILPAGVL
jgi:hypothetical protein